MNTLMALEKLTAAEGIIPKDALTNEQDYLGLLKSQNQSKPIINICEYLLESLALQQDENLSQTITNTGFWFKLGLRYFKDVNPD
jgi:hypothetical protein